MSYGIVQPNERLLSCDRCGAVVPARMETIHSGRCLLVAHSMDVVQRVLAVVSSKELRR